MLAFIVRAVRCLTLAPRPIARHSFRRMAGGRVISKRAPGPGRVPCFSAAGRVGIGSNPGPSNMASLPLCMGRACRRRHEHRPACFRIPQYGSALPRKECKL